MVTTRTRRQRPPKRLLITVTVQAADLEQIKDASQADHRTVSAWVRLAIAEKLSRTRDGKAAA